MVPWKDISKHKATHLLETQLLIWGNNASHPKMSRGFNLTGHRPGTGPFLAPSHRKPQRERPAPREGGQLSARTQGSFFQPSLLSVPMKTSVTSKSRSKSAGVRNATKAVSANPKNVCLTVPAGFSFAGRPCPTQHPGHSKQCWGGQWGSAEGVHDRLLALNRSAPMIPLEGKGISSIPQS